MKKSISVSNLTLDLYLDYVRPAAIAAGIIELTVTEDGKQVYVTDTATADEIAHCMYCACMCAGNDGIERTHEEYVKHEAERMVGQLEVSIKYDLHGYAETLTKLLDALIAILNPAPAEEQTTDTEEKEEEQNMKPEYKHIYVEEARRQLDVQARALRQAAGRAADALIAASLKTYTVKGV